jgi:ADP-heptose:LPS heptosyltransferase
MGGEACKLLEQGWENEKRVHKRSGVWEIRESMTFLEFADAVVGPETGIMNAASALDVPKVVFLSHSSDENLTRDWDNTIALWSHNTSCPGRGNNEAPACHQMHYNWGHCKNALGPDGEKSGVAQCQYDISIEQAWHAIQHAMKYEREKVA